MNSVLVLVGTNAGTSSLGEKPAIEMALCQPCPPSASILVALNCHYFQIMGKEEKANSAGWCFTEKDACGKCGQIFHRE